MILRFTCFVCLGLVPSLLPAHELPDGVVERDVQVVIFPERLEVQYSVEMNAETMRTTWKTFDMKAGLPSDERLAWDRFRLELAKRLPKEITIQLDGKLKPLRTSRSETLEKHGVYLTWIMVADVVASSESRNLVIEDKNFIDKAGYHRLALKGRRGVVVENSSVPVIVSQVPRDSWSRLTEEQKRNVTRAEAQFHLP